MLSKSTMPNSASLPLFQPPEFADCTSIRHCHPNVARAASTSAPQIMICIEKGVKESTCRSCGSAVDAGLIRVRLSYPSINVQYATRSGSPSFCLHPECLYVAPVDYEKTGSSAWKAWTAVKRFELKSEAQITGLEEYPNVRHYFARCMINGKAFESGDKANTSHTPPDRVATAVSSSLSKPAGIQREQQQQGTKRARVEVALAPHAGDEDGAAKQHKLLLEASRSKMNSGTLHQATTAPMASQRISQQCLTTSKQGTRVILTAATADNKSNAISDSGAVSEIDSDVTSESTSDADSDSDGFGVLSSQLQWCKPGAAAQLVGVSSSILRNWANTGAVQTIVSKGGHRLFEIESIKLHIQENAARATEQAEKRMKQVARRVRVFVFVTLSNVKRELSTPEHEQQLQSDVANVKAQIMKSYHPTSNSELKEHDVIVMTPSTNNDNLCSTAEMIRLLQCLQKCSRSTVVLKTTKDVSNVPSTYLLFQCICRSLNATIEIVPELYSLP